MAATLTAAAVERIKPDPTRRLELADTLLPGLYLVVQPSGAKSWAVRYRHDGKPRKATLGSYPKLDLGKARVAGRQAFQAVALGRDPGAEKIEARRQARTDGPDLAMVDAAIDAFLTRHVRANCSASTARSTEHLFKLHVRPQWKGKRLDAIRKRDVVELVDRVVDRGSPVAANRVFAAVRKFLNWSLDRGLLEVSPATRLKPPTEETSRDRVLSDAELRLAWLASGEQAAPFGPLVRLLILTAQRRDEVGTMTDGEVEIGRALWTIPAARAKNGVASDVPLSDLASAELASVTRVKGKAGYVFTTSGETPFSGFSKCKARLDDAMLALARKEVATAGGDPNKVVIPPWRLHDLRRTAASGMARLGHPPHVVEAVLNHVSGTISGVAAIYNRHRYVDEKRAALDAWAEHVKRVIQ